MADVVLDIEVVGVNPNGGSPQWCPGEPLAVAGDVLQSRGDEGPDSVDVDPAVRCAQGPRVEDGNAGDMEVCSTCLQSQERGVERREALVIGGGVHMVAFAKNRIYVTALDHLPEIPRQVSVPIDS